MPLKPGATSVNFGAGKARYTVSDLALFDFFNIPNALFRTQTPVSHPATVSFDIAWDGPISARGPITGPKGSSGQQLLNTSSMSWSAATSTGFKFASTGSGTSFFAQLAHVKNGSFG